MQDTHTTSGVVVFISLVLDSVDELSRYQVSSVCTSLAIAKQLAQQFKLKPVVIPLGVDTLLPNGATAWSKERPDTVFLAINNAYSFDEIPSTEAFNPPLNVIGVFSSLEKSDYINNSTDVQVLEMKLNLEFDEQTVITHKHAFQIALEHNLK